MEGNSFVRASFSIRRKLFVLFPFLMLPIPIWSSGTVEKRAGYSRDKNGENAIVCIREISARIVRWLETTHRFHIHIEINIK